MPIARLQLTALDCPDHESLAGFYSALTGWPVRRGQDEDWIWLESPQGATLAFQQVAGFVPPTWPTGPVPQQLHLDFGVADLDTAEGEVLALGARKAAVQPGISFRVYLDPAGHPFCLVLEG